MIVCEQVTKSYPMGRGRKHVLKGVDLQIRPGAHVAAQGVQLGADKLRECLKIFAVHLHSSNLDVRKHGY